jgi:hypothetical protein
MQVIGYAVLDDWTGKIAQVVYGETPAVLSLRNLEIHAPKLGVIAEGLRLVEVMSEPAPAPFHVVLSESLEIQGDTVIATRTWRHDKEAEIKAIELAARPSDRFVREVLVTAAAKLGIESNPELEKLREAESRIAALREA